MTDDRTTRATSRRFVMYMDPRICPTCGGRSQVVVGARAYCAADAADMRTFLGRVDEITEDDRG